MTLEILSLLYVAAGVVYLILAYVFSEVNRITIGRASAPRLFSIVALSVLLWPVFASLGFWMYLKFKKDECGG